jgi:uncharacterized protein with FMN-binding domain
MKRALLIAGGTVGGIGAVLSITPPQLSSQGMTGLGLASSASAVVVAAKTTTSQSPAAVTPPAATPASSATPVAKKRTTSKKSTKTHVASRKVASTPRTTPRKTTAPTPMPAKTVAAASTPAKAVQPTPANNGASGTFTGSAINVNYGIVQVQITVANGKITDARAIQAPSGRSGQFSTYALPILRQETLVAQSSQIQGVSGASYTSYGWYTSLVAALAKAGL